MMDKPEGSEERPRVTVRDRRRVHPEEPAHPTRPPSSEDPEVSVEEEPEVSLQDLEKVRAESAAHLEDLQRLKAEFENYRKRVLKEQTRIVEAATQPLVARLLEVLDDFELALGHAGDQPDEARGFTRGVEMVFAKLADILRAEGVERIEAEGKPFDPELHEALLQGDGEGEPFVEDVLRTGYTMKGRVIRPAGVKVGRR